MLTHVLTLEEARQLVAVLKEVRNQVIIDELQRQHR